MTIEGRIMTADVLTHDEHKAAEAAFRGLPPNPKWSASAQKVYFGILAVTNGRDVVTSNKLEPLAIGGAVSAAREVDE